MKKVKFISSMSARCNIQYIFKKTQPANVHKKIQQFCLHFGMYINTLRKKTSTHKNAHQHWKRCIFISNKFQNRLQKWLWAIAKHSTYIPGFFIRFDFAEDILRLQPFCREGRKARF